MPALTPIPNIGSQVERAIIAMLWLAYGGTKPLGSFYFSNDWQKRVAPLIDVFAHKSTEEVKHSRVEAYAVKVQSEWQGTAQPGVANPDANWKSINDDIGVVMAALSLTDDDGDTYRAAAYQIAQAGRRLAVLGKIDGTGTAQDILNNADMADFYCDYLEFKGSQRGEISDGSLFITEIRHFQLNACNLADDSLFPVLTFDNADTLNWEFAGALPDFWLVEKSADGVTWITDTSVTGDMLTADITGTGTQYWRVRRSEDGAVGIDPESNLVKATAV